MRYHVRGGIPPPNTRARVRHLLPARAGGGARVGRACLSFPPRPRRALARPVVLLVRDHPSLGIIIDGRGFDWGAPAAASTGDPIPRTQSPAATSRHASILIAGLSRERERRTPRQGAGGCALSDRRRLLWPIDLGLEHGGRDGGSFVTRPTAPAHPQAGPSRVVCDGAGALSVGNQAGTLEAW